MTNYHHRPSLRRIQPPRHRRRPRAHDRNVSWPKASEGGKITGKEGIRDYWTRQWAELNPHVDPLAITEDAAGKLRVHVHQLVKSLQGDVLFDGEVLHIYTLTNSLISAMDVGDQPAPSAVPTPAFTHRS